MDQALFYKAQTSGKMWDTWLYWHQATYYLFNLAGEGGHWHGIALATSGDGVHWREHGLVLEKAEGVTWMGTGSVWEAPGCGSPPRFILNFSEWRGNAQTIFFAESADLIHWRRLGDEYEFRPDARWYSTGGGNDGRWDCIYTIPRPGGGRYGYWTANPRAFTGFGFGESEDGVTWKALAPPLLEWGAVAPMPVIESGAVAEIAGRYYTMLGSYAAYAGCSSGMFIFVADTPAGPFRPLSTNFALLTSPAGRWHTYFARFFPVAEQWLVNHHAIAADGEVYFAPLKLAEVDHAGVLRLKWWPGNAVAAKGWQADESIGQETGAVLPYEPTAGLVLEGTVQMPQTLDGTRPLALVACTDGQAATRFSVQAGGVVEVAEIAPDGGVRLLERIDRDLGLTGTARLRLLLLHRFVELYLNDYLIQVHSLSAAPVGRVTVHGLERAVAMRPL